MTLADMIESVRERISERTENFFATTFITDQLNEGRRRLASAEKWDWLFTTKSGVVVTAGTKYIELIDDVVMNRHFSLVLTTDGEDETMILPIKVSPKKGLELRKTYTTAGPPRFWYPETVIVNTYETSDPSGSGTTAVAQRIRLVPAPDVNYEAEYSFMRRPNALINVTDHDTTIPEDYQDAAVYWAAAQCYLKDDMPTRANDEFSLYGHVLDDARSHLNENAVDDVLVWGQDHPEPGRAGRPWPPRGPSLSDL